MPTKRKSLTEQQPDAEVLRLDNQLCFALYAATRAMSRAYRDKLEPMGLTYPQYLVLLVLWEHDGIAVSAIGKQLMLDSGTLTPLIKRMESMGLVRRERSAVDEREVRVFLTPDAMKLKPEAVEARRYVACRLQMSEPEIMSLRADIMGLINRIGAEPTADAAE